MLNLSPSIYRNADDGEQTVTSKKVYSRRPWYAPAIGPIDPIDPYANYEQDYKSESNGDYYGILDSDEPVTEIIEHLGQVESVSLNPRLEQTPPAKTVSEYSIANAINLREAVLVALGGASAALVLLIVMAGVFCARRRKNSPSPVPSPPILVYPPHNIAASCYLTKEVNFSLPTLRSSSLGELRDVSMSSLNSDVLCPPTTSQYRSNSFMYTYRGNPI
ncbi:unnamed protein product [Euphydryas editha]|uniref:Uncharacterized protein n=1 Tax=Euphydryas editha TaxID=104508 RepID=A0AAU9U0V1_EUPED|nr:unnamed protein product [Euphydryas editha]